MRKVIILILFLPVISLAQPKFYNITNYGAKGDGTTINTEAINAAIQAAAENGGGTVYFPAGDRAGRD